LLDVGCGVGDFYHEISRKCLPFSYRGIDLSEDMINLAKLAYPSGCFFVESLQDHSLTHDVVVACGAFNLRQGDNHIAYLRDQFEFLLKKTKKMCCISLLFDKSNLKYELFYYADPEKLKEFVPSSWSIVIDNSYLDNDFLVILTPKQ
jgi:ubiquinone/menaquinone biosynthesis C-methylase UbiE